jgi:3-oxo-5alpha-steroid 4-dehydrogenase
VFVNVAGQRFINEDCYHGRVSRCAVDQHGRQGLSAAGQRAHFVQPMDFARIDHRRHRRHLGRGRGRTGMPAARFRSTMAVYNRTRAKAAIPCSTSRRRSSTPLDQGPFIALELNFAASYFSFFTLGGLKTSTHRAKCWTGPDGAIAGLYRRRALHQRPARLGPWLFSSGMSLADCTFFGRQAGRRASRG